MGKVPAAVDRIANQVQMRVVNPHARADDVLLEEWFELVVKLDQRRTQKRGAVCHDPEIVQFQAGDDVPPDVADLDAGRKLGIELSQPLCDGQVPEGGELRQPDDHRTKERKKRDHENAEACYRVHDLQKYVGKTRSVRHVEP